MNVVVALLIGAEVLVATPGKLAYYLKAPHNNNNHVDVSSSRKSRSPSLQIDLSATRALILDEADALLGDDTFPLSILGDAVANKKNNNNTHNNINSKHSRNSIGSSSGNSSSSNDQQNGRRDESTQFVFVTATLPEYVENIIRTEFPDAKFIKGPGFHKVSSRIMLNAVIDCSLSQSLGKNQRYRRHRELDSSMTEMPSRTDQFLDIDYSHDLDDDLDDEDRSHGERGRRPNQRSQQHHQQQPQYEYSAAETVEGNKCKSLVNLLSYPNVLGKRIVVFCNSIESCRAAENALNRSDRQQR